MTTLIGAQPSDRTWSYVVSWFIGLSALDLVLTLRLLDLGAVELNPVVRATLSAGWTWAAGVKGIVTAAVAAGLWFGRGHQIVRRTGVTFVGVFGLLTFYELVNVWLA